MSGDLKIAADSRVQTSIEVPILLAGHSHMKALVGDRFTTEPELHPVSEFSNLFALYAPWPRDESYWEYLKARSAGTRIVLVWGGNEHNLHYFFESAHPFDFWSRHVNLLISTFRIIPQQQVRRKFRESSLNKLDDVLACLASSGATTISVVGTPPPKKDSEGLRKILLSEPHFVEWASQIGQSVETVRITPPHIRLKLWFLLQEMLAEAAHKIGAKFIPVPESLRDQDGYLPFEYWASDITHANNLYGQLMLRQVIEALE
jgi:hypothetical protein